MNHIVILYWYDGPLVSLIGHHEESGIFKSSYLALTQPKHNDLQTDEDDLFAIPYSSEQYIFDYNNKTDILWLTKYKTVVTVIDPSTLRIKKIIDVPIDNDNWKFGSGDMFSIINGYTHYNYYIENNAIKYEYIKRM